MPFVGDPRLCSAIAYFTQKKPFGWFPASPLLSPKKQSMASLLLIPDILPGMLNWTCKVMLVEKRNIRESKNTPGNKYRPLVLQDAEGNKVQAMTYKNEIDSFGERMELFHTYLISGAVVKKAYDPSSVPDTNYPNIWTLNRSTFLQNVDPVDALDENTARAVELTPFSALYDQGAANRLISLIAVVIHKFPREWIIVKDNPTPVAEFVIVDEQCLPVVITLWESFGAIQGEEISNELRQGHFPVVMIKNVGLTLFQGLKLGTKFSSSFEIAPNHDRATALTQWKLENAMAIESMIMGKTYLSSLIQIAKPLNQNMVTASNLSKFHNPMVILWLKGHLRLIPNTNVTTYVGCDLCAGRINAPVQQKLSCMQCGQKDGKTVIWYRLPIRFSDNTGSTNCLLYPDGVEKLMSICNVAINDGDIDLDLLSRKLANITFVVGVKRMAKNDGGRSLCSFVMTCLEDVTNLPIENMHTPEKKKTQMLLQCSSSLPISHEVIPTVSTKKLLPSSSNVGVEDTLPDQQVLPCPSDAAGVNHPNAKRKLSFAVDTPRKQSFSARIEQSDATNYTSADEESVVGKNKLLLTASSQITPNMPITAEQSAGVGGVNTDEESIADTDDTSDDDKVVENT